MPPKLIRALGLLKLATAEVNREIGRLPEDKAKLIGAAAQEVIDGKLNDHFPLCIWRRPAAAPKPI